MQTSLSLLAHVREAFEHEKDAKEKMLQMLESVPAERRSDALFGRAVNIAAHLAACRENWLSFIDGDGEAHAPWFEESADLLALRARFAALEESWSAFLARLDDARLAADFSFVDGGESWSLPLHVQLVQLIGHAPYHRGQVALLVDLLGGETVDTDFVDWWWAKNHPEEK